jgi:hypothetical protein
MMHAKMGASKMGTVKTAKPSMGSASKRADGVAVVARPKEQCWLAVVWLR